MRYLVLAVAIVSASTQALAQAGPVGQPGRYIIVHSPHVQRDTILLDTLTGKTWQLTVDTSRDAYYWEPLARGDNTPEMTVWLQNNPQKSVPRTPPASPDQ